MGTLYSYLNGQQYIANNSVRRGKKKVCMAQLLSPDRLAFIRSTAERREYAVRQLLEHADALEARIRTLECDVREARARLDGRLR
jgi:hypothetical protein